MRGLKSVAKNVSMYLLSVIVLLFTMNSVVPVSAQAACQFTPFAATILYHAPILDHTQQKDIVPGGKSYTVQQQAPQYLYIVVDNGYSGFVDRRAGSLSGECGLNVPVISGPLMSFPTLCIYNSPSSTITVFEDQGLQKQIGSLPPNASYAITQRTERSNYVYQHGWIPAAGAQLNGNCEIIRPTIENRAVTLENANLWSEPDVYRGQLIAKLNAGQQVKVMGAPTRGPIRLDSTAEGMWYQVMVSSGEIGWIWSARIAFASPQLSAVVLENARLWSEPNVKAGRAIADLIPGTKVYIVGGPVHGPIRTDSTIEGEWFQVQTRDSLLTGWVWRERLSSFEEIASQ